MSLSSLLTQKDQIHCPYCYWKVKHWGGLASHIWQSLACQAKHDNDNPWLPGTCHTRHASMTDFRPIWGNTVEVTHMTSSVMYINSHAKGTSLPLARITTMIPFDPWDSLADPVTEGPAQWLSPSLLACKAILSPGEQVVTVSYKRTEEKGVGSQGQTIYRFVYLKWDIMGNLRL